MVKIQQDYLIIHETLYTPVYYPATKLIKHLTFQTDRLKTRL